MNEGLAVDAPITKRMRADDHLLPSNPGTLRPRRSAPVSGHCQSTGEPPRSYTRSSIQHSQIILGLADLLPAEARALCSCASLFFARLIRQAAQGDLYLLEAAAL